MSLSSSIVQDSIGMLKLNELREKRQVLSVQKDVWTSLIAKLPEWWAGVTPDAVWDLGNNQYEIVECYIRILPLKSGHIRKIAKDALKLLLLKEDIEKYTEVKI